MFNSAITVILLEQKKIQTNLSVYIFWCLSIKINYRGQYVLSADVISKLSCIVQLDTLVDYSKTSLIKLVLKTQHSHLNDSKD